MSIKLNRKAGSTFAQDLYVRDHHVVADASLAEGGDDAGPSPHDLYDAALGACKALTLLWYARKKGLAVDDVVTEVTHDNSQERQGLYRLHAKLVIQGNLTEAEMQELSAVAEKCPVHKLMTTVTTEITTTVIHADSNQVKP